MKIVVAGLIHLFVLSTMVANASASPLTIELSPNADNPADPQLGDRLSFRSVLTNISGEPVHDVITWIMVLKLDPGHEQPVDLEDWSAQKSVSSANLLPGETLEIDWPIRLMQDGHYRMVVGAASRGGALSSGGSVDFSVRAKPVIEASRIIPVALGIPLLIGAFLLLGANVIRHMPAAFRRWISKSR